MFGVGINSWIAGIDSKEKKSSDQIGKILHKQIYGALTKNEKLAGEKLQTPFAIGYINGFIKFGFIHHGFASERIADRNTKYICDGILPKKLWKIFKSEFRADHSSSNHFNEGEAAGAEDADLCTTTDSMSDIKRLHNYLLDETS